MNAIYINNAVFDTTDPDKITTRVVGIFKEAGLLAGAKNIKRCFIESDKKSKVVFANWEAAMFVSTQSMRSTLRFWHDKKGAASVIEKVTTTRSLLDCN